MNMTGPAVRFALPLRELQEVERAFDVDVMRGDRRELGARREQRREVKHPVDLELGQHAVEQARVGDRSGELAGDERRERRDRADATSSVTIGAPDRARRVTRPWPISPPAPVIRTTGLRTSSDLMALGLNSGP